jgi:hypothetical protein
MYKLEGIDVVAIVAMICITLVGITRVVNGEEMLKLVIFLAGGYGFIKLVS